MAALAKLFAEDANFVNVVGMWWKSRAEIEAAHAATHATIFKESRLEGQVDSVVKLGDGIVSLHIVWTLSGLKLPDGETAQPRRGILLFIAVASQGGWLIKVAQNTDIVEGVLAPAAKPV